MNHLKKIFHHSFFKNFHHHFLCKLPCILPWEMMIFIIVPKLDFCVRIGVWWVLWCWNINIWLILIHFCLIFITFLSFFPCKLPCILPWKMMIFIIVPKLNFCVWIGVWWVLWCRNINIWLILMHLCLFFITFLPFFLCKLSCILPWKMMIFIIILKLELDDLIDVWWLLIATNIHIWSI